MVVPGLEETGWVDLLKKGDSYWRYRGEPSKEKPHAELTSGFHTDGFVNAAPVLDDPIQLAEVCDQLVFSMAGLGKSLHTRKRVFAAETGARSLSLFLAQELSSTRGGVFPVRDERKRVVSVDLKFYKLFPGEKVLFCEDVLTTGKTSQFCIEALLAAAEGVVVHDEILVFVNRSGLSELEVLGKKYKIVSLVNEHMPIWLPRNCAYCKVGSEAIRPKRGDNWRRLTADVA